MVNIIKEQIGGAPEWLDTKCFLLILLTLSLVLYYGKEHIKNFIGICKNAPKLWTACKDSFTFAANISLGNMQVKCNKTNIKDNCEEPKKEKKKKKKDKTKYDENYCPIEKFTSKCLDDNYRFKGSNGLCYKNIKDANLNRGPNCNRIRKTNSSPLCNKPICKGNPDNSNIQRANDKNKKELKLDCKQRLIDSDNILKNEDGTIKTINIGKSNENIKELPGYINNCSNIPINYDGFDKFNGGTFQYLEGNPPKIKRTDANQGWNHDLTLLCSKKVFNNNHRTFYDKLDNGGWILVRRAYKEWHKSNDRCYRNPSNSNSVYGEFVNDDKIALSFSRLPPIEEYTQFLFSNDEFDSNGIPTKWIIIDKKDLHNNLNNRMIKVQSSSLNNNPHTIKIQNNNSAGQPFISLDGWDNNSNNLANNALYVESNYGGKTIANDFINIKNGGVNVFVRNIKNYTQNGMASARQHHTGWGGVPNRAIDNNTDPKWYGRSMSHTHRHPYAWWEVDLKLEYPISKIEIFNGWEPHVGWNNGRRLKHFNVYIDGDLVKSFGNVHAKVYTVKLSTPKRGRKVKIQFQNFNSYMMLAEVKVWGIQNENFIGKKIETFVDNTNAIKGKGTPEVYNIDKQYFKFKDAEKVCKYFGGYLATEKELREAHKKKDAHWCNPGWVKEGKVMYPIQAKYYSKFSKKNRDGNICNGGHGVHTVQDTTKDYSVNCIGVKPGPDPSRLLLDIEDDKEDITEKISMADVHINPSSPTKWSTSSTMSTGYCDLPPLDKSNPLCKNRNKTESTEPFTNKRFVESYVMKDKELTEELYKAIQQNL